MISRELKSKKKSLIISYSEDYKEDAAALALDMRNEEKRFNRRKWRFLLLCVFLACFCIVAFWMLSAVVGGILAVIVFFASICSGVMLLTNWLSSLEEKYHALHAFFSFWEMLQSDHIFDFKIGENGIYFVSEDGFSDGKYQYLKFYEGKHGSDRNCEVILDFAHRRLVLQEERGHLS